MKAEVIRTESGDIDYVKLGDEVLTPLDVNMSPSYSKVKADWLIETLKSVTKADKKPTLFEYLDSVNYSKKELDPSAFDPYMVNVFLSYHPDAITQADYLNSHSSIPKEMQYKYLLGALRSRKRFSKMYKDESDKEFLNVLKALFDVSTEKATEMARLYSPTERTSLIERKNNDDRQMVA